MIDERLPTGTLVDVYVPDGVRRAAAGVSMSLSEHEQGYVSHYEGGDDAIVMILGGPSVRVPGFCVTSAEHAT